MGERGWFRMLEVHSIWLWRSSIKLSRPPGSTPRRGLPVVLSRKSSRRPLSAWLRCCFCPVVSATVWSSGCKEGSGCGVPQQGGMGGDGGSNIWSGEGGSEQAEESWLRRFRERSGGGLQEVSERKDKDNIKTTKIERTLNQVLGAKEDYLHLSLFPSAVIYI